MTNEKVKTSGKKMPLFAEARAGRERVIIFILNIALLIFLMFGFRFWGWKGICGYAGMLILIIAFLKNIWKRPRYINLTLIYQILFVGGFFMVLPFYWMVITSFKSYNEAMAFPPTWWPSKFHWSNWIEAWNAPKSNTWGEPPVPLTFTRYFYVSILVGVITTAGSLSTAILAAYAFAKMEFWGRGLFFYVVIAMMMVPGQVLLIPNYITLARIRWLDHYAALTIPWMASVFTVFLLRQFFITIPADLWDAAQIDGAGRFRFLYRVVLPLSKPVLITAGIFDFLGNWNSLFWPLIVTTRPEMRTLMVGLQAFNQDAGSDFNLLMAASTFAVLPIVIMFFFLQRFFIQGIARTGFK